MGKREGVFFVYFIWILKEVVERFGFGRESREKWECIVWIF